MNFFSLNDYMYCYWLRMICVAVFLDLQVSAGDEFCVCFWCHFSSLNPSVTQTCFNTYQWTFLVADTRLYILPCRSVCWWVRQSATFTNFRRFSHYCSCPNVRDWIAVYLALYSFIHSFVHSFIYSFIRSFIHSSSHFSIKAVWKFFHRRWFEG